MQEIYQSIERFVQAQGEALLDCMGGGGGGTEEGTSTNSSSNESESDSEYMNVITSTNQIISYF